MWNKQEEYLFNPNSTFPSSVKWCISLHATKNSACVLWVETQEEHERDRRLHNSVCLAENGCSLAAPLFFCMSQMRSCDALWHLRQRSHHFQHLCVSQILSFKNFSVPVTIKCLATRHDTAEKASRSPGRALASATPLNQSSKNVTSAKTRPV